MSQQQFLEPEDVISILGILYLQEGTWDKVATMLDMSKGSVHHIAVDKIMPKDDAIRAKLGLAPLCPHCGNAPLSTKRRQPKTIFNMSKPLLLWALENRKEML